MKNILLILTALQVSFFSEVSLAAPKESTGLIVCSPNAFGIPETPTFIETEPAAGFDYTYIYESETNSVKMTGKFGIVSTRIISISIQLEDGKKVFASARNLTLLGVDDEWVKCTYEQN